VKSTLYQDPDTGRLHLYLEPETEQESAWLLAAPALARDGIAHIEEGMSAAMFSAACPVCAHTECDGDCLRCPKCHEDTVAFVEYASKRLGR